MSWVKLDDQVAQHPKVLKAGPVAAWTWVCCIAYASRHLTDGFVPYEALATFGVPQAAKHATKLVEVGLLEPDEGGYRVHDYHEYNAPSETVKAKRQEVASRVGAWRQKRTSNAPCNSVTPPLQVRSNIESVTCYTRDCNARPVPVQYQVPPCSPPRGAIHARPAQLWKRAEELRRKAWGRCPHEPPCETYDACIARIVEELQARQADVDQEATG
jgi:hypothetical protein